MIKIKIKMRCAPRLLEDALHTHKKKLCVGCTKNLSLEEEEKNKRLFTYIQ